MESCSSGPADMNAPYGAKMSEDEPVRLNDTTFHPNGFTVHHESGDKHHVYAPGSHELNSVKAGVHSPLKTFDSEQAAHSYVKSPHAYGDAATHVANQYHNDLSKTSRDRRSVMDLMNHRHRRGQAAYSNAKNVHLGMDGYEMALPDEGVSEVDGGTNDIQQPAKHAAKPGKDKMKSEMPKEESSKAEGSGGKAAQVKDCLDLLRKHNVHIKDASSPDELVDKLCVALHALDGAITGGDMDTDMDQDTDQEGVNAESGESAPEKEEAPISVAMSAEAAPAANPASPLAAATPPVDDVPMSDSLDVAAKDEKIAELEAKLASLQPQLATSHAKLSDSLFTQLKGRVEILKSKANVTPHRAKQWLECAATHKLSLAEETPHADLAKVLAQIDMVEQDYKDQSVFTKGSPSASLSVEEAAPPRWDSENKEPTPEQATETALAFLARTGVSAIKI